MRRILMSWLRMSILAIAGLLVGAADAAASAGPNRQDACRRGGVSLAAHLASAAQVAAGPIVDRTRWQIDPVDHGAARGKETLIGDATAESEQPPDRETVLALLSLWKRPRFAAPCTASMCCAI
jgi:hypothetical protein